MRDERVSSRKRSPFAGRGGRARCALLLAVSLLFVAAPVGAAEITPFYTFDQRALVQIYGLPAPGRAKLLAPGEIESLVAVDLANDSVSDGNDRERILLDGETLRTTLGLYRGFTDRFEAGIELPIVDQSGGFMDGFIEGWHHFFRLPNGDRSEEPRNRLLFRYEKDGNTRLNFTDRNTNIGDLRLTCGTQLYRDERDALALRALVKLPTGDSSGLTGSGSTDAALWLTGNRDFQLKSWGNTAVFGALGGLAKTEGDILRGQQRYLVGFGTLGAGWSPTEHLAFKFQFSSHTPFYRDSELVELNAFSTLLVLGGTVAFTDKTALDIGVSEDVAVDRSPDVSFHLGLTTRF